MGRTNPAVELDVDEMTDALNAAAAPVEITPEIEARLDHQLDVGRTATALADAMAVQQFECGKVIGQVQMLDHFRQYSGIGLLKLLKQMKDTKAYKGMRVPQADGSVLAINTFEDVCGAMGVSYSKVAEDLQNLTAFGEEFLESAKRMGLRYSDLRKLRALPEDARQMVIEGEKLGDDPEALKDFIEDQAARNAKLREEIKEKDATLKARDEVLSKKNKQLDAAQTELAKLKSLPPDKQALLRGEKERAALEELHKRGLEMIGTFAAYLAQARSIFELEGVSPQTTALVTQLTSGLCSHMAEDVIEAEVDVDFRILVYPLELGDIPMRGDAHHLTNAE